MVYLKEWLNQNLAKLNNVDKIEDPHAFSRLGFTVEEAASQEQFLSIARELNLTTYRDKGGNYWATWEVNQQSPTIAMGSHLDTVYEGGGYDGVAGVLCALACVKMLKEKRFQPSKNIAIICFIAEESARFGVSSIGSKAISGELDYNELVNVKDKNDITVRQAVEKMGISWDSLGQAMLPHDHLEQFVEVHIEQGSLLQENNSHIGIVSKIARPTRLVVTACGESNHTGTTPMQKRNDALVAISPLVSYIRDKTVQINNRDDPSLVATVSTVELKPNSMTTIPGEVQLGIDIRSVEDSSKKQLVKGIRQFCRNIEEEQSINIQLHTLVDNKPVALDAEVQEKLLHTSRSLSFQTEKMTSGAGHDAMNMARRWPTGMVFIPCRDGVSHHPKEYTETQNLINATELLMEYIESEATT